MSDEGLYHGLTAEELDRQYDFRAQVPDYPEYFNRWTAASAALRADRTGRLDLHYGPDKRQRLDLFPGAPGAPLVVFFHGGYWRSLSKDVFTFLAGPFLDEGIGFAAVNYGLCPDTDLDAIVVQARDAVSWLAANGAGLGVDPGRMVIAGHSAGAHLAVMMAETDWAARGLAGTPVRAAVGLSGLYDLEPLRHTRINEDLRLADTAAAQRVSPVHHVPPPPAPPLLLSLGGEEAAEVHRQQSAMVGAWRARGLQAEARLEEDAHHYSVLDRLADSTTPLHRAVRALIDETARG